MVDETLSALTDEQIEAGAIAVAYASGVTNWHNVSEESQFEGGDWDSRKYWRRLYLAAISHFTSQV